LVNEIDNLFAFILGREQKIARLELESVLRHFDICFDVLSLAGNVALINIERGDDCLKNDIMSLLGGTMEIFKIIAIAERLDPDSVYSQISSLSQGGKGRVTFGISDYSKSFAEDKINALGLEVKKKLKETGSSRFVALRGDSRLSAAAIISNRLDRDGILLGIFSDDNRYLFGKLVGVSDPSDWSRRDFGKPKSDKFAGMTPPKLARMMVNITLGQCEGISNYKLQMSNDISNDKNKKIRNLELEIRNYNDFVVLDPFCGSGNILLEAAVLGCQIIGSDISEKAVNNTVANLNWLKSQTYNSKLKTCESTMKQLNNETMIFQTDATKFDFSSVLGVNPNQANEATSYKLIVTEPYLGQPKKFEPSINAVKGEYEKVKKLYLDFLENVCRIGHKISAIAIVFPLVETVEGKRYSLFDQIIDKIKEMGYTLCCEPLVYGREYQVVKREIIFLSTAQKKDTSCKKQ